MPDKVLAKNVSTVTQVVGAYVIRAGETMPIPLSLLPAFGGAVEVYNPPVEQRDTVTIYRSMCKPDCGHSLCNLTRGLTVALQRQGFDVIREDWRPDIDQPKIGHTYACNSASFEGPSGKFSWPHPDADIAARAHAKWLKEKYTGHICSSQAVKDALIKSGIEAAACHVVNDAIDTDLFCMDGPALDQWGGQFIFLMLGALNPRKGFDCALEAYGKAFTSADNVLLVLKDYDYGWGRKGWCQEQVERWKKKFGANAPKLEYVYDTWQASDIAAAYRRAAKHGAYLMPSRCEGFGLTGLEAMACGCRVGVTGWSGQVDYATQENATLFRHTFSLNKANPAAFENDEKPQWAEPNIDDIAAWMRRMVEEKADPVKQREISENVRTVFSFDRMASEFAAVLGLREGGECRAASSGVGSATSDLLSRSIPLAPVPITRDETLGIGIPTRDRNGYLAALLGSLFCQTKRPQAICIVDDSGAALNDPCIKQLLSLFEREGIRAEILKGTGLGASPNHQVALSKLRTDLILRLDDDLIPSSPEFVERLYALINRQERIGAVAGIYPGIRETLQPFNPHATGMDNRIDDMLRGKVNLQFRNWHGEAVISCEHLYSSWMYRRSYLASVGGFAECYSRFGQREETDASVRLKLLGGYELLVDVGVKAYHFLAPGGRRPEGSAQKAAADDAVFRQRLAQWRQAR